VALVVLQVLHYVLLLSQLGIEELRVALELLAQTLIRGVQEPRFVPDALEEGVVDLVLNVVSMILGLLGLVVLKQLLHLLLKLALLLV